MRVTILDYGVGNLHSLAKAVAAPNVEVRLQPDPFLALETDLLLLPGVGAFDPAAERLAPAGNAIRGALDAGLPCLGVCLGMQLLFRESEEGARPGLGVLPGRVRRIRASRVPQMGWNAVEADAAGRLTLGDLTQAYYANSYVCEPEDPGAVLAWSEHQGDRFPAVVRRGSTLGVQFHPEKSSWPGRRFLLRWVEGARR